MTARGKSPRKANLSEDLFRPKRKKKEKTLNATGSFINMLAQGTTPKRKPKLSVKRGFGSARNARKSSIDRVPSRATTPRVKKGSSRNTASQKFLSLISNYTPGSKMTDTVPKSSFLERTQNPSTGDVFMI